MVSPDVVGNGSEYFVVYFRVYRVCSADYVELPVLLYLLQGRAARVRCTTKSIAKKSTTGSLSPAVPLAITPTFSPWTHTSDDSYIYQLSLVSATATVSSISVISTLFGSLMLGVSHAVEVLVLCLLVV